MGWGARNREGRGLQRNHVPLIERPGVVCTVSGDRSTYPQFAAHVATIQTTPGSQLLVQVAGGGGIAAARNKLAQRALDAGAGWVFFVDDDQVFAPDILRSMLGHDKPMVSGHILLRVPPHRTVGYEYFPVTPETTDAELLERWRTSENITPAPGQRGLVECGHGGTGGLLIAREVFEAVPRPWFEMGRAGAESAGEDSWFILRARRAGFPFYVDLDAPMGHLTSVAIWPRREKDTAIRPYLEFDSMAREARLPQFQDIDQCGQCGAWLGD